MTTLEILKLMFFIPVLICILVWFTSGVYAWFKNMLFVSYMRRTHPDLFSNYFDIGSLNILNPYSWFKFVWKRDKSDDDTVIKFKSTLKRIIKVHLWSIALIFLFLILTGILIGI